MKRPPCSLDLVFLSFTHEHHSNITSFLGSPSHETPPEACGISKSLLLLLPCSFVHPSSSCQDHWWPPCCQIPWPILSLVLCDNQHHAAVGQFFLFETPSACDYFRMPYLSFSPDSPGTPSQAPFLGSHLPDLGTLACPQEAMEPICSHSLGGLIQAPGFQYHQMFQCPMLPNRDL